MGASQATPELSIEDRIQRHLRGPDTDRRESPKGSELPETPDDRLVDELESGEPGEETERVIRESERAEEADDQAEEEEAPESAGEESDPDAETPLETVSQWAKAIGVPEADLLALTLDIDGKPVALSQLRESYTTGVRADPEEIRQARAEFAQRQQQLEADHQANMHQVASLTSQLLTQIEGEAPLSEADWHRLEAENPPEFTRRRIQMLERNQLLQNSIAKLKADEMLRAQNAEQVRNEFRRAEAEKLLTVFPEWRQDPAAMQTEIAAIGQYLTKEGLGEDDLAALDDHRYIVIARKAMLYDKLDKAKALSVRRVKDAPKRVAPSVRREQDRKKNLDEEREAIDARGRASGTLVDAAARLQHRIERRS